MAYQDVPAPGDIARELARGVAELREEVLAHACELMGALASLQTVLAAQRDGNYLTAAEHDIEPILSRATAAHGRLIAQGYQLSAMSESFQFVLAVSSAMAHRPPARTYDTSTWRSR